MKREKKEKLEINVDDHRKIFRQNRLIEEKDMYLFQIVSSILLLCFLFCCIYMHSTLCVKMHCDMVFLFFEFLTNCYKIASSEISTLEFDVSVTFRFDFESKF